MNIAVLGSTGYLGKRLVKALVDKGHNVLCIKRPSTSFDSKEIIDIKKITICNIEDVNKLIDKQKFDCFINLSCLYQKNNNKDIDIFEANYFFPLKMFQLFADNGITKHITIDTSLPRNLNTYCFSKKQYSDTLKRYQELNDSPLKVVNVLLENYYGPNEPIDRFIPSTIVKLKNNEDILLTLGDQMRDWIYIDDVIDALVELVKVNITTKYIDFPLGTGESIEIREIIAYLKKIIGSKSKLLFGAIEKRDNEPNTCADISLMKKYGIHIKNNWKDGFKKII